MRSSSKRLYFYVCFKMYYVCFSDYQNIMHTVISNASLIAVLPGVSFLLAAVFPLLLATIYRVGWYR
jgi:hypothetical protein